MTMIDSEALSTVELHGDICNIVERNYRRLPLPGAAGDDGLRHISDEARAASTAILDLIHRATGAERPTADLVEFVRGSNPGHSDAWYAAYVARLAHYASGGDMADAPELPAE